jgi:hypothetical protein
MVIEHASIFRERRSWQDAANLTGKDGPMRVAFVILV